MEKWSGKTAVITGASAGIGEAILRDLVPYGVNVVGLARRVEKVQQLADELKDSPGKVYAHKCDVMDLESVRTAFKWVEDNLGGVDILINSAGLFKFTSILNDDESTSEELAKIINANFTGLVYCTREAYKSMNKRGTYGYIINLNSIAGHSCPFPSDSVCSYNVYCGTKYAVTATTEVLRQELVCMNNKKIRVSSLSPGETKTEMVTASGFEGNLDDYYNEMPALSVKDITDGVIYILSTPYHVQVAELTIRPVGEKQ